MLLAAQVRAFASVRGYVRLLLSAALVLLWHHAHPIIPIALLQHALTPQVTVLPEPANWLVALKTLAQTIFHLSTN